MNIRSAVVANGQLMSIAPRYEDALGHMTIDFDGVILSGLLVREDPRIGGGVLG